MAEARRSGKDLAGTERTGRTRRGAAQLYFDTVQESYAISMTFFGS